MAAIFYRVKAGPGPWIRATGSTPFDITGLTNGTVYEIEDGSGTLIERTPADVTVPVLSAVSFTDGTGAIDWAFTSNEDVTYRVSYWTDGSTPSDATIESGTGSIATVTGSATAATPETGTFTPVTAGTYVPTIYVEDAAGNKTFLTGSDVTVAGGVTSFSDDLVYTAGQLLTTANAGYVAISTSADTFAGDLAGTESGYKGNAYNDFAAPTKPYRASITVAAGTTSTDIRVILDYTDVSNYYYARANVAGSSFVIRKVVAGSDTVVKADGSPSAVGAGNVLTIERLATDVLVAYIDGVEQIRSDAAETGAALTGKGGFQGNSNLKISNLTVEST